MKEARYQLRQSPQPTQVGSTILPQAERETNHTAITRHARHTIGSRRDNRLQFQRTQKCLQCGCGAVVAHHLAKVRVASSNLVIRSSGSFGPPVAPAPGGVAERLGSGLQSRLHGFESRLHLTGRIIGTSKTKYA